MGHEIKLVAHFFSSSDLTAQVICWDRGRLARTRIISIVVPKSFSTLFALRAHCRRDAHGPSKSLDHGSCVPPTAQRRRRPIRHSPSPADRSTWLAKTSPAAHSFSSSDSTAQVICWDRGRLARTRNPGIVFESTSQPLFALRAHCGRDAHGPGKSLDHGSVYHLLRSEGVDQYAIHLHRLTAQPGWRKLRLRPILSPAATQPLK